MRQKITLIAEVFEKKSIDPSKYTLDLLCDFIHDKAKKLYAKIEHL